MAAIEAITAVGVLAPDRGGAAAARDVTRVLREAICGSNA
jgi:hypothetical protein